MNKSGFVEYILDLLSCYKKVTARRMFGGYGIYSNKIIFALIIDNELYFKIDGQLAQEYKKYGSYPFTYQRNNQTIAFSYWYVPVEIIEDSDLLKDWFNKSFKVALENKLTKQN